MLRIGICLLVLQVGLNDEPSKADVHFGKSQVEQIILDRPEVSSVLESHPEIRYWMEKKFAGAGERIYWISKEPKSGTCECIPKKAHDLVAVLVTSSNDRYTPHDKLAMLVFELHNATMPHMDLALLVRKVKRDEFVLTGAQNEHRALVATKKFLNNTSFSEISRKDAYASFILSVEEDFDDYIETYRSSNGELSRPNPFTYWGKYFDAERK